MGTKKEKEQEKEQKLKSSGINDKEHFQDITDPSLSGDPIKPDGTGGSTPLPGSSGSGHGPEDKKEYE